LYKDLTSLLHDAQQILTPNVLNISMENYQRMMIKRGRRTWPTGSGELVSEPFPTQRKSPIQKIDMKEREDTYVIDKNIPMIPMAKSTSTEPFIPPPIERAPEQRPE
jgi:hypothetical protein